MDSLTGDFDLEAGTLAASKYYLPKNRPLLVLKVEVIFGTYSIHKTRSEHSITY
jgi:hypothetical protein